MSRSLGRGAVVALVLVRLALPAAHAGAQQQTVKLDGLWEDIAGNVHQLTQTGASVTGILKVAAASATRFGFAPGDSTLRLALAGKALNGQMHLHYEMQYKTRCPGQWDFWDKVRLQLGDSASNAIGQWHDTKIDTTCTVKDADTAQVDWYIFRPLVLENLRHDGFTDDTAPPLVIAPTLPRFFVDKRGHASVDLDASLLQGGALTVQIVRDGSVFQALQLDVSGLQPTILSSGKWFTLDLHQLFGGTAAYARPATNGPSFKPRSLYDDNDPFTMRVVNGGSTVAESPVVDKWAILGFIHTRQLWLAKTLWRTGLEMARGWEADMREGMAWQTFQNYRRPSVFVTARNRGRMTQVTSETVRLYALFEPDQGIDPTVLVGEQQVTLPPGRDSTLEFYADTVMRSGFLMSHFKSLYAMVGTDTQKVSARIADRTTAALKVTVKADEPWLYAAALMSAKVGTNHSLTNRTAVAHDYLENDPDVPASMHHAPHQSAVEWASMIQEFNDLEKRRKEVFGTDSLARLHEAADNDAKDHEMHVGLPYSANAPSVVDPNAPTPGVTVTSYVLSLPGWEQFKRGLMAFATGGVAAGDVPLPTHVPPGMTTPNAYPGWQGPSDYPDAFLNVPSDELSQVAKALGVPNGPQLSSMKGEVAEALANRLVGQQIAAEKGPKAMYVPGYQIMDYRYDSNTGELTRASSRAGTKVEDGAVLYPSGRKLGFVGVETKSGNASEGATQLATNEGRMLDDGLTIRSPTPQQIQFFQDNGYNVRTVVKSINGGPPETLIHLQQGTLQTPSDPAQARVLVVAQDEPMPQGNGSTYTGYRLPATREQLSKLGLDLIELQGTPTLPPTTSSANPEMLAAASQLLDFAAAGASEADRIGRLRLRVTMCKFDDPKRDYVGVMRGFVGTGGVIEWENQYREASVQKVLLESWYRASSMRGGGDVPPWLANAKADGSGDRCN